MIRILIIECTKKLTEELKTNVQGVIPIGANPIYSWHANVFNFNRRKCVVLMNSATRYSIVLYGLKKEHFSNFDNLVMNAISENLVSEEFDKVVIEDYMKNEQNVIFTKTHDKSILSQMNDIVRFIEYRIYDYLPTDKVNLIELNKENNRTPMSALGVLYPIDAMKEILK